MLTKMLLAQMFFGLGTGGFIAVWCLAFAALWGLIAKFLALLDYRVEALPAAPSLRVGQLKVGMVNYGGIVTATTAAGGLGLRTSFLFRIGHPPVLIPWAALAPFEERRLLWVTTYRTAVHTRSGGRVRLQVADKRVVELLQQGWVAGQENAAGLPLPL
jgi:hypothetical protein